MDFEKEIWKFYASQQSLLSFSVISKFYQSYPTKDHAKKFTEKSMS
jgi:hypothetical protein